MKKFIFMMVAMIGFVMNAQTIKSSTTVFDNSSVTLKGGVSALMHPECNGYENLGHTFAGNFGVQFDKMITPIFGVGVEGMFGLTNGSKQGYFQGGNVFNYATVMAQAKMNVTNLLLGYDGTPRKFEVIPTVGIGWIHGWYKSSLLGKDYYVNDANDLGTKFSIEMKYNFAPRLSAVVNPYIAYNFTDSWGSAGVGVSTPQNQPRFDARNAWWGLEAGVSYRLGENFQVCPYSYTQAEVDALNAEINALREEVAKKPKKVVKEVVKEVTKEVPVQSVYMVLFSQNSAELTDVAKETLNVISGEVDVVATASPEGTERRNNELSQQRADVVKAYLESKGVKVVSAKGLGVEGETSNRIATIFVK